MKPTDTLTTLFSHNLWANLQLLERCSALSSEQLAATIPGAYGSICATLQHIVTGEQLYFSLITTGQRYDRPEDAPPMTLPEMTEAVRTTGAGLIEWAPRVQAAQVDGEGVPKTIILTQAINHATEHRAQIMAILTQLGIQPPVLDGWTYFETHSQPQGFLAVPPAGKGPGVLVLHAWWGLNDTIKAFCTRLAQAGFVVFAPDLYHGKVAVSIADAETLGKAVDANFVQTKAEVAEAARFLNERAGDADRGLAVIGFSLGAYYAVDLAAAEPEQIRSVVLFYGTGDADLGKSKAAFLGHFAENDLYEPQSNVDGMEKYLMRIDRPATFYRYSGAGHWFFEPDRVQEYNQAAATLAWDRTLAFLMRQK